MKKALSSVSEQICEGEEEYHLRDERRSYGSEEKEMLPTRLMQGQKRLQTHGDNSEQGLVMQAGSSGLSGREDLNK